MKEFRQNILLAALILFLLQAVPDFLVPLFIVSVCVFWIIRVSLRSVWMILILVCCGLIPLHETGNRMPETAAVAEVHDSWCILQSGRKKLLFYSDGPLLYDTEILLDGSLTEVPSARGFFRFDFASYLKRRDVFEQYVTDEVHIAGSKKTIRRVLQKKLEEIEDPLVKAFVYRTVFGINNEDLISGSLLGSGFSCAAVLMLAESLMKRFVQDSCRKVIIVLFNVFLICFYGFRLVLVSSLIRRLLSFLKLEKQEKTGFWAIVLIIIFQKEVYSAGFLIPAAFMISGLCEKKDSHFVRWTAMGMIQSFLYQKVSPFQSLFFPFILRISGVLWLYGMLIIFFPQLAHEEMIALISSLRLVTDQLVLPGSLIGLGLPVFVILVFSFYRSPYSSLITAVLFYLFLVTGMFHPFAEVTFINVGQGDAILIREPFNLCNILIDTGKPTQYKAVKTMLDAKGIRRLDTLFITHTDSDHSGNMEPVIDEYRPSQVITEHQGTAYCGPLVFHDLNSLDSDDENQSSIVLVFQLNGMTFVLPGDADQITEETIVRKYGNLRCDVLKLSHHGSKTGSCDLFLDTLKPKLGIVSSGAWQIYHHPSEETVQRLLKRHIPYLDTKDHGDISIFMIGPLRLLVTADGIIDLLSWQGQ